MEMTNIKIILGSTRPERFGEPVAKWFYEIAKQREDLEVELIDLKDINLPLLDELKVPAMGEYEKEHTKAWSKRIAPADGYVFITAEYNHGVPAALKNAIDFLYAEWNNKAVGFVSYGADKGVRSVEQLRMIVANAQMADVRGAVSISTFDDVDAEGVFKPTERHEQAAEMLLDQLTSWSEAMKSVREK